MRAQPQGGRLVAGHVPDDCQDGGRGLLFRRAVDEGHTGGDRHAALDQAMDLFCVTLRLEVQPLEVPLDSRCM